MIIDKLLSADSFWMVNKYITKEVGIEAALLLSDLASKQGYFDNRNELTVDGFFFNTSDDILSSTTLSYHLQKQAISKLKNIGFIETKLKGVPAKLHFKVIENKILNFLNTGFTDFQNQGLESFETNKNITNKNKEKNKDVYSNQLFPDEPKMEIFNFKKQLIQYGGEEKLIDEWLRVRKAKKAVNTETALNQFLHQVSLSELGINEVLTICVGESWKGFKVLWLESVANKYQNQKSNASNDKVPYQFNLIRATSAANPGDN